MNAKQPGHFSVRAVLLRKGRIADFRELDEALEKWMENQESKCIGSPIRYRLFFYPSNLSII